MLYVIGLGLADEKDITIKGLDAVKKCSSLFLESYTSLLLIDKSRLEKFYGKSIIEADRDTVESQSDLILAKAAEEDVGFLVVGDPFGATTHTDLVLRAIEKNIPYKVIHNASIMNAIGSCGLQLYSFGQTVSIVFFSPSWRPDSFYARIKANKQLGLHTLCLLDIKVKEQSELNLLRNRKIYEPPRFMTVNQAIEQMLEVEEKLQEGICSPDTLAVGMARVGSDDQIVKFGTLQSLLSYDFGPPLHCLIIPGTMHELEVDFLRHYQVQ